MLNSKIEIKDTVPRLVMDGQTVSPMAYTTYFEERSCCEDFIRAGYRIFFVNLSFTTAPINPETEFSPFRTGVFENPDVPDYSEFETAVLQILQACPDAVIFPRIYISMPKWWVDTHPDAVTPTDKGALREIMFSETFRKDGAEFLREVIHHLKNSDYAPRIGGWMICGGSTQEWIYRNYKGNLCAAAKEPYRAWVLENYGIENADLPDWEDFEYQGKLLQESENARRYSLFCNLAMAETVNFFAEIVKQATGFSQVVGTFYGYTFEALSPLLGTFALRSIIDSPNLDFFSSPNAYTFARAFGMDWADMIPVDSIRHHKKLCFIECDIRTYLTVGIQKVRPGEYPDDIYTTNGVSLWVGPPTVELSRFGLRKSFAHQIVKANAVWWFDMWGGWYDDPLLMKEMASLKKIQDDSLTSTRAKTHSDVVFFADEQSYANVTHHATQLRTIKLSRTAMGKTGVPYDSCMVEDADSVLEKYQAAVFPFPIPSEAGKHAVSLCQKKGIPYLAATPEHSELTADEITAFYRKNGLHFYSDPNNVVYFGNGYIGLHSSAGGMKRLKLKKTCTATPLFGADIPETTGDTIEFSLKENDTALFLLKE